MRGGRDARELLYNLKKDLAEKNNVAEANPQVVRELKSMLSEFQADIQDHSRPVGVASSPRTLVPRPGVEGEAGYLPTLSLPRGP